MKLEFYNCPKPEEMDSRRSLSLTPTQGWNDNFVLPKDVGFLKYVPDFQLIDQCARAYGRYRNLLIIGHGGSVTSFYGFYHALKYQANKQVFFLSTVDPDYILVPPEMKFRFPFCNCIKRLKNNPMNPGLHPLLRN